MLGNTCPCISGHNSQHTWRHGPLSDRRLADLHAVLWPARHPLPLRRYPLASSLVLLHTAIQTLSNWHIFEAQDLPMK